ncbi:hypothetical protein D9M71_535460 [compost metagenome]
MVAEGDQRVAGQGGEEFHLEQLVAQRRLGPGGLQARHQLVDALAGDGEVVEQDRRVLVALFEHRIVPRLALAPQAELGAQAVVLARRVEQLRLGRSERRQQRTQALGLVLQLGVVLGGVETRTTHGQLGEGLAGADGYRCAQPILRMGRGRRGRPLCRITPVGWVERSDTHAV